MRGLFLFMAACHSTLGLGTSFADGVSTSIQVNQPTLHTAFTKMRNASEEPNADITALHAFYNRAPLSLSSKKAALPSVKERDLPGWLGEQAPPEPSEYVHLDSKSARTNGEGQATKTPAGRSRFWWNPFPLKAEASLEGSASWVDRESLAEVNSPKYQPSKSFTQHASKGTSPGALRGVEEEREQEPRVEQVSWEPRAWLVHHFLSDEEADHIIHLAQQSMSRSTVVGKKAGDSVVDSIRTSTGTFVPRRSTAALGRIEERIAQFAKLPVENGEALQVLHYGLTEEYRAHQDTFLESMLGPEGQRIATALMFLNTPEAGGQTIFPLGKPISSGGLQDADDYPAKQPKTLCADKMVNGIGVNATKGSLLFFFDMTPDGKPDPRSTHQACPVTKGEKWSAPKWIHVREFGAPKRRPGTTTACRDKRSEDLQCEVWAQGGECKRNVGFMIGSIDQPGECVMSCIRSFPESVPQPIREKARRLCTKSNGGSGRSPKTGGELRLES